jgi:Xaa-Pro aminopeptidase
MFSEQVYINRRKKLASSISNGLILLPGNTDLPYNYKSNTYRFRQDSSFLYFFGLDLPNIAGIINTATGEEIIFGNDIDIDDIIWMGNQPKINELAVATGVHKTLPFAKLGQYIADTISKKIDIHFLPQYRAENLLLLEEVTGFAHNQIKSKVSEPLIKAIVSLRSKKELCEIEEIEQMVDVAWLMHTTAMKMAKPGMVEKEIAATIEGISLTKGHNVSFPVICSTHGEILHNINQNNTLEPDKLLLVDAGVESAMHYASDITRTTPVGGKFSQQQKEIYEIVLQANLNTIKVAKPGIAYKEVHLQAAKIIAEGLKTLGLMKGNTDEIVASGAHALFFPHGLGHMLGLDVHDMEGLGENFVGYNDQYKRSEQFGLAYLRMARELEEGFVVTDEPGIYFIPALIDLWRSEKKFTDFINYDKVEQYNAFGGIRIEDDLLITQNGCRVLGKSIPKTIKEIEETVK